MKIDFDKLDDETKKVWEEHCKDPYLCWTGYLVIKYDGKITCICGNCSKYFDNIKEVDEHFENVLKPLVKRDKEMSGKKEVVSMEPIYILWDSADTIDNCNIYEKVWDCKTKDKVIDTTDDAIKRLYSMNVGKNKLGEVITKLHLDEKVDLGNIIISPNKKGNFKVEFYPNTIEE